MGEPAKSAKEDHCFRVEERAKAGGDLLGLGRALLCIFLPPLAVLDKGCGSILIVTVLTLIGWIPGIIAALIICKES